MTPTITPVEAPSRPTPVAPKPASRALSLGRAAAILVALALGAVGGVAGSKYIAHEKQETPEKSEKHDSEPGVVKFAKDRWETFGIKTEPATSQPLTDRVWRTGTLQFNHDRQVHITCPVDGFVREVKAEHAETVKAGAVLAVVDSREVGRAKLDLMTARLAQDAAEAHFHWVKQTTANAGEMWKQLLEGKPVEQIEAAFRSRPVGEWRDKLLTAYSRVIQSKAVYDDLVRAGSGVVSEAALRRAKSDAETASAQFRGLFEEARFQMDQQVRTAEQKAKEAKAALDTARAQLVMVGYSSAEVAAMDPAAEGANLSLFPVRSPLPGTVIDKHAVLGERVNAQHQLFQIADLSNVWVKADVFEADLQLVRSMSGQPIVFRAPAAGIAECECRLHYLGDEIDPMTQSLPLVAIADNAERRLKPGMFVEVGLPRGTTGAVVSVPSSAIQRFDNREFVFVVTGEGEFRRRDVAIGREVAGRTEITAGLKAGEVVATEGTFTLKTELLKDQIAGE